MTLFALVIGSVFRAPEQRTSKAGKPFVSATLRVKDGEGSHFVRVAAFSETAQAELVRLSDGDALSVQGPLTVSIYTSDDGNAKIGLSIVAGFVLALRQPPRERKAKSPEPDTRPRQERLAGTWSAGSGEPNDDIGF